MALLGEALQGVRTRSERRSGKHTLTGRYHRSPRVLTEAYTVDDEVLGSGVNGEVYAAHGHSTGQKYAVKDLLIQDLSPDSLEELVNEVEISLAMDHPNVARLVDVYESTTKLTIVTECMSGGDVFDRIKKLGKYTEEQAAEVGKQMLLAINYLHAEGVVHRDVKLDNFLFEREDNNQLKLIDFGFGRFWEADTNMARALGTLSYIAPEVINRSYTSQCDMWSFGVCIFILLFGLKPFRDPFYDREDVIIDAIMKADYKVTDKSWNSVSCEAQEFVKCLLVVDPNVRLTAAQALHHPWILQNNLQRAAIEQIDSSVVKALVNFGQMSALPRASFLMTALSMPQSYREKVRDAFLDLDVDDSGGLSFDELRQLLVARCEFSDEEIVRLFGALDSEHDGLIHYSDFLAAMAASHFQLKDDLLKAAFCRFDVDGDGTISVEDMKNIYGETFDGYNVEQLLLDSGLVKDRQISYSDWVDYLTEQTNRLQAVSDSSTELNGSDQSSQQGERDNLEEVQVEGDEWLEQDEHETPPLGRQILLRVQSLFGLCICLDR